MVKPSFFKRSQIRCLLMVACMLTCVEINSLGQESAPAPERSVQNLAADYIRLYTRSTLPEWKKLFHPSLSVANPNKDGSIQIRNLEEFYATQETRFATGRTISERLEHVSIRTGNRMASISADFIFSDNGKEGHGKLGLHAIQDNQGWRIVAIIFSYD